MKLDYVTIEKRDGIAIVRFDRKANLNAFNEKLVVELTHAARSFHDDLETHAVVLAGAPNGFSAGFDLKATDGWTSETDDLKRRQRAYGGVRLCKAWEAMPQITIAAMERLAVGAGVAIALACDWRVLGRGAYLYVPEVKIGLNLQWGALPRLITLVGPARAKRICHPVREDAGGAGAGLGAGRRTGRRRQDGRAGAGDGRGRAVDAGAHGAHGQGGGERHRGALHAATAFADADQSQLTATFRQAKSARDSFRKS